MIIMIVVVVVTIHSFIQSNSIQSECLFQYQWNKFCFVNLMIFFLILMMMTTHTLLMESCLRWKVQSSCISFNEKNDFLRFQFLNSLKSKNHFCLLLKKSYQQAKVKQTKQTLNNVDDKYIIIFIYSKNRQFRQLWLLWFWYDMIFFLVRFAERKRQPDNFVCF